MVEPRLETEPTLELSQSPTQTRRASTDSQPPPQIVQPPTSDNRTVRHFQSDLTTPRCSSPAPPKRPKTEPTPGRPGTEAGRPRHNSFQGFVRWAKPRRPSAQVWQSIPELVLPGSGHRGTELWSFDDILQRLITSGSWASLV